MNEEIKKGDFIEIEYTGKITKENKTFDTTNEEIAKKENIYSQETKYGPATICVGEKHLIKGIDESLEGKKVNEKYEITIKPEEAFGKKNPKLLQIVPMSAFRKSGMRPIPGMQINLDGMLATIKTVSGGRVIVDFNHPLSGRDLTYDIKINRKVENADEKIKSLINLLLKIKTEKLDVKINNEKAEITIKELKSMPKEIETKITEKIKKLVPEIKEVNFKTKTEEKNK